ncbi:hypothetical protein [Mucilaginibacter lacusdianchii]|uniref:hypothetical protein n=1 Tax=Mucilaginibacter lacusdianchii TaxID=2684211 RepID=UPI00131BE89E|nr:hypothetical protein [Mucilaginibacter sp. JXJ CY 39]
MKKTLLILVLFIAFMGNKSVKAQVFASNERYSEYLWHVSFGVEGLYNINPGKNYYTGGYGGSLKAQYDVTQNLGVTISTGYFFINHDTRPGTVNTADFKYIPVKLGAKAYFLPEFYLGGEVGVASVDPSLGQENTREKPDFTSKFAKVIAPSVGYETNNFDASIRYENINHQNKYKSFVALRVAYIFNW